MNQFKSLADIANHFSDEEKCRTWLEKFRWPDGRIVCPLCGIRGSYRMGDCKTYKCRDKDCKSAFSITKGTWFENTKLPLSKWFIAIYLITAHKKGISSHQLARDLGIRQKAAWFVLHRVREMIKQGGAALLQGIVAIDEAHIGGRWANMNKTKRTIYREEGRDNKTPIMGMVEKGGNAKLIVIGKDTLKAKVRANVDRAAMLVTDEQIGYSGLVNEYAGHVSINHSRLEFKKDGYTTNPVEGLFSLFKRGIIGIYHHISPWHLQRYCEEFTFRFNSRKIKDVDRFEMTFKHLHGRLTWKQLTADRPPPKRNYKGIEFIEGE